MDIIPAQAIVPVTSSTIVSNTGLDATFFRNLEKRNIYLNAEQIQAVRSTHSRLKVVAGAGCGKTSFLVVRAAYLIDVRGFRASTVLVITYTRKACQELKDRIDRLVCSSDIVVTTIHAFCYRILQANGLGKHNLLTDDTYKKAIIKRIIRQLGYDEDYTPESVMQAYALSISSMMFDTTSDDNLHLLRIFYAFNKYKEEHGLIDFDDILTRAYTLLCDQPPLCYKLQQRFHHILVDEFQDICPLENQILSLIIGSNDLCVVGDPRQTIFGFRGSDITIIDSFENRHNDCQVINLDINYRSTPTIVGLGNYLMPSYIKLMTSRASEGIVRFIKPKDMVAEAAEVAECIVQSVSSGRSRYNDYALIYRTGSCLAFVLDEFVLRDIPFIVFGGNPSIYGNSTVKLILAHIRLAIDPTDIDSMAIISPTMYINKDSALKFLRSRTLTQDCLPSLSVMPSLKEWQYDLICCRIKLIQAIAVMFPAKAIETLINDRQLVKFINPGQGPSDINESGDILTALKESAARFDSIVDYLGFVDKVHCHTHNSCSDAVTLSSIHSAKGLEFHTVFLLNAIDGMIPHQRTLDMTLTANNTRPFSDLEEERRLLYVAVTRATDELIISVPKERDGRPTRISRYLKDII